MILLKIYLYLLLEKMGEITDINKIGGGGRI